MCFINEDTVTYDIHTNTVSVIANECVIDFLTEKRLLEIVKRKYRYSIDINFKVSIIATASHISEINLPSITVVSLELSGSIIKGPVNFYSTKFSGEVNCKGTVFQDEVVFLCAYFHKSGRFDYSVFDGELDLTLVEGQHLSFERSRFNETVFCDELFLEEFITFENAYYAYDLCISRSFIKEGIILKGSQIGTNCVIYQVTTTKIDFSEMKLLGKLDIKRIKGFGTSVLLNFDNNRYIRIMENVSQFSEHGLVI